MDLQICQYIIYKSTVYLLIKRISLIIIIIIIFLWIATITYFNHVYMPSMECIITPETFKKVKITAEKKKLHYLPRYFGIKCKPRHQNK